MARVPQRPTRRRVRARQESTDRAAPRASAESFVHAELAVQKAFGQTRVVAEAEAAALAVVLRASGDAAELIRAVAAEKRVDGEDDRDRHGNSEVDAARQFHR